MGLYCDIGFPPPPQGLLFLSQDILEVWSSPLWVKWGTIVPGPTGVMWDLHKTYR